MVGRQGGGVERFSSELSTGSTEDGCMLLLLLLLLHAVIACFMHTLNVSSHVRVHSRRTQTRVREARSSTSGGRQHAVQVPVPGSRKVPRKHARLASPTRARASERTPLYRHAHTWEMARHHHHGAICRAAVVGGLLLLPWTIPRQLLARREVRSRARVCVCVRLACARLCWRPGTC